MLNQLSHCAPLSQNIFNENPAQYVPDTHIQVILVVYWDRAKSASRDFTLITQILARYSETCLKRPLKNRQKEDLSDRCMVA